MKNPPFAIILNMAQKNAKNKQSRRENDLDICGRSRNSDDDYHERMNQAQASRKTVTPACCSDQFAADIIVMSVV